MLRMKIDRPTPSDAMTLKTCRVYLTANPIDRLWKGQKQFSVRAFLPHRNNAVVILEDGAMTYWPQYPQDFKEHPAVHRCMEFIYYTPQGSRTNPHLAITTMSPGRYFLRVHESWREALISGAKTHQDLYAAFASSNPIWDFSPEGATA